MPACVVRIPRAQGPDRRSGLRSKGKGEFLAKSQPAGLSGPSGTKMHMNFFTALELSSSMGLAPPDLLPGAPPDLLQQAKELHALQLTVLRQV